ncbi:MAG TPA: sensor histidine kinase [Herpetosiphonaceae bacterium]|nr:sensor histidine kinase [Herpetosiphonaceae bacterium]
MADPIGRAAAGRRSWKALVAPQPYSWVSTFLYLGVLAVFLYSQVANRCACPWWKNAGMIGGTLALLALERLEFWRWGELPPRGAALAGLAGRIVLIEVVSRLEGYNFGAFLYVFLPFIAWLHLGRPAGLAAAALVWLRYFWLITRLWPDWYARAPVINDFLTFTVGIVFVLIMANVVMREQASRARSDLLLRELADSHRRLQQYAGQAAELATIEERNRLARDIHDSLGHYLTVINVQLEKALAFRDKKPAEADQSVAAAKQLASSALGEVRRSVGALRESERFSLRQAVTRLVEAQGADEGALECSIEGSEQGFSRPSLMVLYRAVQEGLTNIQKHARASRITLDLRFEPAEARLLIRDDGVGFAASPAPGPEGGYGLPGLSERLEQIGGNLRVESHPGAGTSLIIAVPRFPAASGS